MITKLIGSSKQMLRLLFIENPFNEPNIALVYANGSGIGDSLSSDSGSLVDRNHISLPGIGILPQNIKEVS